VRKSSRSALEGRDAASPPPPFPRKNRRDRFDRLSRTCRETVGGEKQKGKRTLSFFGNFGFFELLERATRPPPLLEMAAAAQQGFEPQQENVQYAPAMVAPGAGFHPNMMQAPVILPAGAQLPTPMGTPAVASAIQPPDMSMAQWVSFQGGMQMMVPVQMQPGMMMMQPGMPMMPQMVHQAEQNGLPPGAPCMWVPALGTSAKPEKAAEGGQRSMPQPRAPPRLIAPKYAPPMPSRPKVQEYVKSGGMLAPGASGLPVAEVKVARPVVARPGAAGISKPAPAKGGARGAKGINMKWRTRYVL
jgi:hypothetical protein